MKYSVRDVSNVTSMIGMFTNDEVNATYTMDLSGWDVAKVTSYNTFNDGVADKITLSVLVN